MRHIHCYQKSVLYPTIQLFQQNYWQKIFNGKRKNISIENWTGNIYKVRYEDDALSTGIYDESTTIQDYITITADQEGKTKLNINNYIGKRDFNIERSVFDIKIKVLEKNQYMDFETYTFEVTNQSNNAILLGDLNDTEGMYLEDSNNIKYFAYIHEKSEAELKLNSGETRKVTIKYYNKYGANKAIRRIIFSKVIRNYNAYANFQNLGYYQDYGTIQIDL